ncbi:MAG: hypothetical protein AAF799_33675 [Myxococcota bacterium]
MTEEDEILHALGEDLRDREDQLSRGDAPEALSRLLSSDERGSVLDGAFARLDASEDDDASNDADTGTDDGEATSDTSDNVVPLAPSPSRGRGAAITVVVAVVAVAAMLLLWWGSPRSPSPERDLVASLPSYSITRLAAGQASDRAGEPEPGQRIELQFDGPLDLVLTPKTPFRDTVAVVVVARRNGVPAKLVRPAQGVEISANGGIHLKGPLNRFIALSPGEWTLELLVGPPDALPESLQQLPSSPDDTAWRTLSVHATVTSPSG